MTSDQIIIERLNKITVITLNRSEALNAFNSQALFDLKKALDDFALDESQRVTVITGKGRAFCSGADIKDLKMMDREEVIDWCLLGSNVYNLIVEIPKPVIAAVNGYALGGGCELALACDFRVASETAVFAMPEVTLGWIPGWGGAHRLANLVGVTKAKEIIMLGRRLTAQEALNIGLVNKVVSPPEALLDEACTLAEELCDKSGLSLAAIKNIFSDFSTIKRKESLLEAISVSHLSKTEFAAQKIKAFEEKMQRKR